MARVERLRRRRAGDALVDVEFEGGERLRVHERRILEPEHSVSDHLASSGPAAFTASTML